MTLLKRIGAGTLWSVILVASPVFAGTEHDDRVKADLLTVITLQGRPCGKATAIKRLGEHDYLVTCETGDRYRVHLSPTGQVLVEPQ